MSRWDDIDPQDINPDTGAPYGNYSSPSLDTSFHDGEMDDDDSYPGPCTNAGGHSWVVSDETDRCYCEYCCADGDA